MTKGEAICELYGLIADINEEEVADHIKSGVSLQDWTNAWRCRAKDVLRVLEDTADTPQTDWHYDEQDATWYPYKHEEEPQQKSCATCKHALGNWDGESNNCGRCCGADRRFYEPKTESQTERSE